MSNSTEQMLIKAQLEQPKATQGIYTLPCGYIDEENVLHTEVELSELTGNEEDLLASPSVANNRKMGLLIGRCVKRLGTIIDRGKLAMIADNLTIGDRTYLMFALRRITLGDQYPFKSTCPSCSRESTYEVDMSQLEIKKMKDPMRRIYDATLPSGRLVRFRVLTGADENKLSSIRKMEDKLSTALVIRLEMLDGKPPTLQDIKQMSMRDRDDLRAEFDEHDGGVDTSLEMRCTLCGAEFNDEIDPGQAGFFFPSVTRKRSKTRSSS